METRLQKVEGGDMTVRVFRLLKDAAKTRVQHSECCTNFVAYCRALFQRFDIVIRPAHVKFFAKIPTKNGGNLPPKRNQHLRSRLVGPPMPKLLIDLSARVWSVYGGNEHWILCQPIVLLDVF